MSTVSRRRFLKGTGALVLSFSLLSHLRPEFALADLPASLRSTPELDAWIRINVDNTVTVFTGKVELGQGIKTALAQVAAEELDVAFDQIEIITAATEITPDEGYTAGSNSIEQSGAALRAAAAEVRHILVGMAAERLDAAPEQLEVFGGIVSRRGDAKGLSYGELIGGQTMNRVASGKIPPKPAERHRLVGQSIGRLDIPGKVFGAANYVQDLRLEGMVHGRILFPPSYGAQLQSLDDGEVRQLPSVVRVVRDGSFVGVIAEREEQAVRALDRLRELARWSEGDLPGTPDDLYAHLRSLPTEDQVVREEGMVDSALETAETKLSATYKRPYQAHASLAPSCAVAKVEDEQSGFTKVWTHSQGVYPLRRELARLLDIPEEIIQVTHLEGAGCYGHNGADDAAADAALLARAVPGRPVRVQWMREDEFSWEPYGSAMLIDIQGGLNRAGNVVAWNYEVLTDTHSTRPGGQGGRLLAGWHRKEPRPLRWPGPMAGGYRNAETLYSLPNMRITARFFDGPLRVSALRSLGAYANTFANESFIDELAAAAGADPVEFRLRHLTDPRARAVIEAAAEAANWEPHGGPSGRGLGMAFARYKNTSSYTAQVAEVEVDEASGQVRIRRVVVANDSGQIVNPDGVKNQLEGGTIQGVSWTLLEEVRFDDDRIISRDWASYPLLTFRDVPEVDVVLIKRPHEKSLGAGETSSTPIAAAIANAIFDATGARLRELPFTPARVKAALDARG